MFRGEARKIAFMGQTPGTDSRRVVRPRAARRFALKQIPTGLVEQQQVSRYDAGAPTDGRVLGVVPRWGLVR